MDVTDGVKCFNIVSLVLTRKIRFCFLISMLGRRFPFRCLFENSMLSLRVILAKMCVKLQMRSYVCHRVGPFLVHFGSIFHSGSISGPFWVHFGSISGPFRVHFGSISGPNRVHFGSILGPFGVQELVFGQESVFTQESVFRQESMFRQECSSDKNSSLDC